MFRRSLFWTVVVLGLAVVPLLGADWWHWRGPWQNGVSPEKNLPKEWSPEGKNLIWKAPYGSRSTPLVMNGRVYLINSCGDNETIQERVMCLDADTGKVIKEHKFNVFHSDIVTVRLGWTDLAGDPKTGNIYAHGTQGFLNCYDKDLKLLWSRQLTEEFGRVTGYGGRVTSPTVDENVVIIGMVNSSWGDHAKGANRFVAFDKNTGQVVWWSQPVQEMKGTYYSHPIVVTVNGERLVMSGTSGGSVAAIKLRTGEPVWNHYFSIAAINSSPVFDPKTNYVYIGQGEESPDTNVQGRLICLDASKVEKGEPKLVWQKDGIKARYASPILDTEHGLLYVPDDISKLYCFDAASGKQLWRFGYGRNARGSPVLADGKIYVGDVFSKFLILEPGAKKCTLLHEHFFPSADGVSDVELNGTPAVANGRVYFATSDEMFCIGLKDAKPAATSTVDRLLRPQGKGSHLQILPGDLTAHPGETVTLKLRLFDEHGNVLKELPGQAGSWSLPTPPVPPGKQTGPPPLKAQVAAGKLTIDAQTPSQQGYVACKVGELTARSRVRVAPRLPYKQDFEKIPDGAVPGGWVNTQGKFVVAIVKGSKVLRKVNNNSKPPIARGYAYIGLPSMKDYTIECDVQGSKKDEDMPEVGIGANRYTLLLAGNIQKLRLLSWEALPRIDQTIGYSFEPGVWYRMKLTVDVKGPESAVVKGKVWRRDQKEPDAWTITVEDPRPNTEGAPCLYGYVTGIVEPEAGNDIYYDNLVITPNKK